jgi:hypothetical protein
MRWRSCPARSSLCPESGRRAIRTGPGRPPSFLAALSILLADPQWNLESSGGRHVSGILFRPDAAGLDPSLRATPAPYGYVVGVFAEPDAVRESALTVWVRVSATSPYVQAKCAPWLHVADAPTDEDRALQADRLWQELPHAGVISVKRMAQELYGDAPGACRTWTPACGPPSRLCSAKR